jgi:hypothetical protein
MPAVAQFARLRFEDERRRSLKDSCGSLGLRAWELDGPIWCISGEGGYGQIPALGTFSLLGGAAGPDSLPDRLVPDDSISLGDCGRWVLQFIRAINRRPPGLCAVLEPPESPTRRLSSTSETRLQGTARSALQPANISETPRAPCAKIQAVPSPGNTLSLAASRAWMLLPSAGERVGLAHT